MKIIFVTVATLLFFSTNASAALIERLGGLAYYDDVVNLTWLANANAGAGSVNDDISTVNNDIGTMSDGRMTWQNSLDWAARR